MHLAYKKKEKNGNKGKHWVYKIIKRTTKHNKGMEKKVTLKDKSKQKFIK